VLSIRCQQQLQSQQFLQCWKEGERKKEVRGKKKKLNLRFAVLIFIDILIIDVTF